MERLLNRNEDIKDVVDKINDLVDENFDVLGKNDDDIVKWTTIPDLIGFTDVKRDRLIKFINYLDLTRLPMIDKSLILISLSGLIRYFDLDITKYEDGNLYLISNHYQNTKIEIMKKTIPVINNNRLLLAVRNKTLDLNARKIILKKIEYQIYDQGIDTSNNSELTDFINIEIKKLNETDFYR